jgi:hypothetical protein
MRRGLSDGEKGSTKERSRRSPPRVPHMRGRPRPHDSSRPCITCLLLEGDGTLLNCLCIIHNSSLGSLEKTLPVIHNKRAPAAVFSLQQCNTSASPYLGEIGVNGTIHTQFLIINGDVCVNIFSSAWL